MRVTPLFWKQLGGHALVILAMVGVLGVVAGDVWWTALSVAAGVAFVVAVVVAGLQVRAAEQPVRELTESAEAMAAGEFGHRAPQGFGGAFDELAAALNRLATESREQMDIVANDRSQVLAILGVMVEGVIAVDAGGRIVHMNAAAAKILGTQVVNTEGRRVPEVTRVPEVQQILSRILDSGREEKAEIRMVQPPRDRHVEVHGAPLADADGEAVGVVLMLHDVTELRRLEAIRRDFVANVSHELKTPITAIRGMVETVIDDREMEVEVRSRFLSRIRDQSHRLSSLVTDLLTLSRLESDGDIGEMVLLDLRGPVEDSVKAQRQHAEDGQIELHVELPAEPLRVVGEVESLRLFAGNLIDNAVKYTPEHGNVWVRLRADGPDAVLEIIDDGIGIEPKHLDRIFQRFYRVDKARSRELGGTGLGLSIVRHVCLAHRGDVSVESRWGEGSKFSARIPLA